MAVVSAGVANGGVIYYPNLIDRVISQEGEILRKRAPRVRTDLLDNGVKPEQIEIVRKGMWKVVNEWGGTGRRAKHPNEEIAVAGKTGTVQAPHKEGKTDAWFISFAPYEKPTLAVCVMVEGAKAGGKVPAPISGKIIRETLALEHEPDFELKPLAPAEGNFKFVEEVNFELDDPVLVDASAESIPDAFPSGGDESAAPDIEPEADERGRIIPRATPVWTQPIRTNQPQVRKKDENPRGRRRGGRPR